MSCILKAIYFTEYKFVSYAFIYLIYLFCFYDLFAAIIYMDYMEKLYCSIFTEGYQRVRQQN